MRTSNFRRRSAICGNRTKYYYDGDSCIEERNGSDETFKQMVWGTNYIDELVQIILSTGEYVIGGGFEMDSHWICQDANYNVLGMVSSSGGLEERYEYSPYGQRKTFFSAGANDAGNYAPTLTGRRGPDSIGGGMPWAKNEFGHQGLMHDEEIDLVYNRARHLHPGLGRFMQRDALDYHDSNDLYEIENSAPPRQVDPSGNQVICLVDKGPCERVDVIVKGNDFRNECENPNLGCKNKYEKISLGVGDRILNPDGKTLDSPGIYCLRCPDGSAKAFKPTGERTRDWFCTGHDK